MTRDLQLSGLLEALYEAVLTPAEWTRFLELTNGTFEAGIAVFAHYDHDRPETRHTIGNIVGRVPWDVTSYEEHFSSRNAWVNAGREQVAAGVVLGEQLVAQPEFEQSEYYNDFLRRIDLGHVMAAGIRGDGRQFTALSILRSKRIGAFEPGEVALLEHVLPHLKRAVQIHERVASVERGKHPLAAVADGLHDGLVLLDARGRTLFANRAALSILGATEALQLTGEGICALSPVHDLQLRRLVRSASSPPRMGDGGGGGEMTVPRAPGSRPLHVLVTPLGSGAGWLEGRGQAAAVWLRDPDTPAAPRIEWLRGAFGLTPAEAALATLLAEGHDLAEAARRQRVTIHTARTQLKAALQKTGTHTQADLVRVILNACPGVA